MAPAGHDPVGWLIIAAGTIVTSWAIIFAVRALFVPGEARPDHPKLLILKDDR